MGWPLLMKLCHLLQIIAARQITIFIQKKYNFPFRNFDALVARACNAVFRSCHDTVVQFAGE